MLNQIFDEYGRKAQLYPALLVVLPPLLTMLILFPSLMSLKGSLGALVMGCGSLVLLANLARSAGRRKQPVLFPDRLPAQRWLRHRDTAIEPPTKDRYKQFLSRNVPGLRLPTRNDEEADPVSADHAYESAVRWLTDQTRGDQRVKQELAAYGFRRNLFGLKPWGVTLSMLAAAVAAGVLWRRHGVSLDAIPADALAAFAFDAAVAPALWLLSVRREWVKEAAESYGLALLGSCDRLGAGN